MKQMNGLDRMFLHVESERLPMDMFGILLLDPSTAPDGHDYARFRTEMATRLPRIPVFTRRPVMAPWAGHEHWVVDPHYSIDRHLKHLGAPAPHDLSALCELAVNLVDDPLDRDRPLWQMYYVDGLDDGSAAILIRLHHAAIDGVGGTEMLAELFDSEPLPRDPALAPGKVAGDRVPSQVEMLLRSVPDQIMAPLKVAQSGLPVVVPLAKGLVSRVTKVVSGSSETATSGEPEDEATNREAEPRKPGPTPRSVFNRVTESPKRSLAVASLSMADMATAKDRYGVTHNDVVLAVTSAAVTDYLRDRDELPAEPLRVAFPVNVRDDSAEAGSGNHFSFMMVAIPDIDDPVERLKTVSAMTKKRKPARTTTDTGTARKPTGSVLGEVMGLVDALPSGAWLALGQLVNSPAVGMIPPVTNYFVSNIPGPKDKLYVAGAEITHLYGRTMVGAGVGLFIHCLSYNDTLDFGFTALAELVPDPERIAEGVKRHLALLLDATNSPSGATDR